MLLIHCSLLLSLLFVGFFVLDPCFVVCFLVPFLVLRSSCWGGGGCLLGFSCFPFSRDLKIPHLDLSHFAVCIMGN